VQGLQEVEESALLFRHFRHQPLLVLEEAPELQSKHRHFQLLQRPLLAGRQTSIQSRAKSVVDEVSMVNQLVQQG
jgi:hypothetical protein